MLSVLSMASATNRYAWVEDTTLKYSDTYAALGALIEALVEHLNVYPMGAGPHISRTLDKQGDFCFLRALLVRQLRTVEAETGRSWHGSAHHDCSEYSIGRQNIDLTLSG